MNKYILVLITLLSQLNAIFGSSLTKKVRHQTKIDYNDDTLDLSKSILPDWVFVNYYMDKGVHVFVLTINKNHKLKNVLLNGVASELPGIQISKLKLYLDAKKSLNGKITFLNEMKREVDLISYSNLTKFPEWVKNELMSNVYSSKIPLYVNLIDLPKEVLEYTDNYKKVVELRQGNTTQFFMKGLSWNKIWEYICPDSFEIIRITHHKKDGFLYVRIELKSFIDGKIKYINKTLLLRKLLTEYKHNRVYLRRRLGVGSTKENPNGVTINLAGNTLGNEYEAINFYNKILVRVKPELSDKYKIAKVNWGVEIHRHDNTFVHALTIEPLKDKNILVTIFYTHGGEQFIARHLNVVKADNIPKWIKEKNEYLVTSLTNTGIAIDICEDDLKDLFIINANHPDYLTLKVNSEKIKANPIKEITMNGKNVTYIDNNQPLDRILVQYSGDKHINILTRIYERWNYDLSTNIVKYTCKSDPSWLKKNDKRHGTNITLVLDQDKLSDDIMIENINNLVVLEPTPKSGYCGMHNVSWDQRWIYTTDNMAINVIMLESVDGNLIEISNFNISFYGVMKYKYQINKVKIPAWMTNISPNFAQSFIGYRVLDLTKKKLPENVVFRNDGNTAFLETINLDDEQNNYNSVVWEGDTFEGFGGKIIKISVKADQKGSKETQIGYIDGRLLKFKMFASKDTFKIPKWEDDAEGKPSAPEIVEKIVPSPEDERKIKELENQNKKLEAEKLKLEKEIQELKSKNVENNHQEELDSCKKDLESEKQKLNTQNQKYEKEVRELKSQNKDLEKLKEIEQEKKKLEQKAQELEGQIKKLETKIEELESKSELNVKKGEIKEELDSCKKDLESEKQNVKKEREQRQAERERLEREIQELKEKVKGMEKIKPKPLIDEQEDDARNANKEGVILNLCNDKLIDEIDTNKIGYYEIEFAIKENNKKTNEIVGVDWGTGVNYISYADEKIEKVILNIQNNEIYVTKLILPKKSEERKIEKGILKCPESPKWLNL